MIELLINIFFAMLTIGLSLLVGKSFKLKKDSYEEALIFFSILMISFFFQAKYLGLGQIIFFKDDNMSDPQYIIRMSIISLKILAFIYFFRLFIKIIYKIITKFSNSKK